MVVNYRDLDAVLGANAEVIHKDPRLGRLHDELVVEVKKAESYFYDVCANNQRPYFEREHLSKAVQSKYKALMTEAQVRYKIKFP